MNDTAHNRPASYGFDAPYALIGIAGTGLAATVLAFVAFASGWPNGWFFVLLTLYFLASAASYTYATRYGKFRVWAEELEGLGLQGTERVLDLGCGRGAVLLHAAKRLDTGRATGVDLWRTQDQSGNAEAVTRSNAEAEGVSDRVDLATGDLRALPFEDAGFDLVVSSLALHNIPAAEARERAITEAYRVLAPGGRLLLADIRHASAYAATLRRLGAGDVTVRGLGPRFWFGGPLYATRMVSAHKPV